ncbi:hypothetical protein MTO96_046958 [Rhipicephalus appendiculatus]
MTGKVVFQFLRQAATRIPLKIWECRLKVFSKLKLHPQLQLRRGPTSSTQQKSKKKKTKDANEDDIKQVTGAFMQAVAASSQKQPVHQCTSFDFMAESAKELTPIQQDRLMHECHMALLEIKEV